MQEEVRELINLLKGFETQYCDDKKLKEFEQILEGYHKNPQNYQLSLEILKTSTDHTQIWCACNIMEYIVTFYWLPRSFCKDPSESVLSGEDKLLIRNSFVNYVDNNIRNMTEASSNLILLVVAKMMKIDFVNEGMFWVERISEQFANYRYCYPYMRIVRFLSEDLLSLVDHSISSITRQYIRQSFPSIISSFSTGMIAVLNDKNCEVATILEAFELLKSLFPWISACPSSLAINFHEIIEILITYGRSDAGNISTHSHICIHDLFLRCNLVLLFDNDTRQQILYSFFEFFGEEFAQFRTYTPSVDYIQTFLYAFQPYAASFFFRENTLDDETISSFLEDFESLTWEFFNSNCFHSMIEIWIEFFHGHSACRATKFSNHFINLVSHIMDALVDEERIPLFSEDDCDAINEIVTDLLEIYSDDISRIIRRATAIAVDRSLGSVELLLRSFFHVVTSIDDDDPLNETISDSFLRYLNELMLRSQRIDVYTEFCLATNILRTYVRKFSRMSLHFLEKVYHLVCVSISAGQAFLVPMLDLLLETLKIERPLVSSKVVLHKLIDLHNDFISMAPEVYSLYLCCCLTITAYPPTDGGYRPIASSPAFISDVFSYTFANIIDIEQAPIALTIMKDAVNSILLCERTTKNLIFSSFYPNIETILQLYSHGVPEPVIRPLFDFVTVFCSIFHNQIGEAMNDIITRLFAPLESQMLDISSDSIEHYATISFLKLLLQIAKFRSPITESHTDMIVSFILTFSESLYNSSQKIVNKTLRIVRTLLVDRFDIIKPEALTELLKLLFYAGSRHPYPKAMSIVMDAIMNCHKFNKILDKVDIDLRYSSFSSVVIEMCKCTHTMMREKIVGFVVFMCGNAPDFVETLLYPFIRNIPVETSDQIALAEGFSSFQSESEFRKAFVDFCDNVAFLILGNESLLSSIS